MEDLIEFMLAQIERDERVIREAEADYFYSDGHGSSVDAWFDRWSPANSATMLPLMAALRKILDGFSWEAGEVRAVAALASALYSERPGWNPDWIKGV